MDSVKVKNFIIIVLLIVNAVLLSVFVSDSVREKSRSSGTVDGVVELLAENGITVAPGVDLSERRLDTLSASRDIQAEGRNVSAVLGEGDIVDQGGNILVYFGDRGEASLRGTGGVDMIIRSGEYDSNGDPLRSAREFAALLGLETMSEPLRMDIDPDTLEGTLELCCSYEGVRVANCTLSFTFASGELMGMSGTRVLDTVGAGSGSSAIDVPTALMRFLTVLLERGQVCSSLDEMELCYTMNASVSGEGELVPVWRIATDTGEFYINAVTGLEETLAG